MTTFTSSSRPFEEAEFIGWRGSRRPRIVGVAEENVEDGENTRGYGEVGLRQVEMGRFKVGKAVMMAFIELAVGVVKRDRG
jgi:hypothetical protein